MRVGIERGDIGDRIGGRRDRHYTTVIAEVEAAPRRAHARLTATGGVDGASGGERPSH